MPILLGALILGALQGVTEFLPISSSGHLVLLQQFIDVKGDDLAFDLLLHLGTLVPVFVLFRADILRMITDPFTGTGPWLRRPGVRWLLFVVIASIPTALMGLALEDLFESMFSSPLSLAWQFAVTAVLLQLTARWGGGTREVDQMRWTDALLIGIAQGVAILPAVSRSGATIAIAMALGLRRDLAGRFSFVVSIPAILGAVVLKLDDVTVDPEVLPAWLLGAGVALVIGWISLRFLMRVIRAGDFSKFAWYCWAIAAVCLVVGLAGLRGGS
jgi:undecaprenyl-diphosphatase